MKSHCSSFEYYGLMPVRLWRMQSAQDYYPFGMVMPGRSYQGSDGYWYGFQGQEQDNEVKGYGNSINFKFRILDSADVVENYIVWVDKPTKGLYSTHVEGVELYYDSGRTSIGGGTQIDCPELQNNAAFTLVEKS